MSERERWIVYPLLFLALGAALRDKLLKQTRAKQIVCEQVHLVDTEGRELARLNGAGLTFELGGVGNGLVRANTIDAQGLFERGKPVATRTPQRSTGLRLPIQDFLRLFPQLRTIPGVGQPAPPEDGAPPAAPRLQPPANGPADQPSATEEPAEEPPGAA